MATTYEKIATTTLASTAASFIFSSISASYTDLRLVLVPIKQGANLLPGVRFNGLTTTIYSQTDLYGDGSTAGSTYNNSSSRVVLGVGSQNTADPALYTCDIFSYAGSTYKTLLAEGSMDLNGSGYVNRSVGLWRDTSAITSITVIDAFSGGFATGTTATLYGILKA